MKKMLFVLAIIFASLAGIFILTRQKVGDIAPAVLPPKELENISVGEKTDFPISAPAGFSVGVFAKDLSGARDLEFTQEGTLFVSLPSSGKIAAVSDSDKDGTGEVKDIAAGLERPHGLAFREGKLYVAEETSVSVYDWDEQNRELTNKKTLFALPAGGRHFTRTLVFDKTGKLYISVGSTCDVCVEKNPLHSAVLISDPAGTAPRLFARGLRNSVFITLNPQSGEIWGTEMGRDFLGDETPPDEVNIIKEGSDYGWPYCYGDKIHDTDFDKKIDVIDPCLKTTSPIYKIPAHSAPLGLTFINSPQFPADWQGDLLVAYHGSWNRSTPTGYKVVRMKVEGDKITGEEDFLTGFLSGSQTLARPVDLIFDQAGSLYISDDKAGYIFKVVGESE